MQTPMTLYCIGGPVIVAVYLQRCLMDSTVSQSDTINDFKLVKDICDLYFIVR